MLLSYFGNNSTIADLRVDVNSYMRIWNVENGSSWDALANAARTRGFDAGSLLDAKKRLRRWKVEDLLAEVAAKRPVAILTHYRSLPGRENASFYGNHFVVVVGQDESGSILYHDPAYLAETIGAYRVMTLAQLDAAWSKVTTRVVYSGLSIKPKSTKP